MAEQSRTLKVVNQGPDLTTLAKNRFSLQVAKSVIKDGELHFNVVWKSQVLAPVMQVKWKPTYGLNWTSEVPSPGLMITLGGFWKQCDPGQVLDIDETGQWMQSTATPVKDYLSVGSNNYSIPEVNGIHIVVGVQSAPGNFDIIYVDETELGKGMTAQYQPQEQIQWWYQTGMRSSTMIEQASTKKETGDYSAPDSRTGTYSKTSSYSYTTGTWKTSSP
ncbi:hypothetical protein P154DRAFT_441112 [Amniculicola lignicola CBS 123094]|uniref:Uncharacterized protein n=1 Tax=Amniculicola lignicola CBS 123094 TaxID=1392246 RepID=A0A6A5W9G0_9PLEO|nr:hypothetical protein P154DRAFT_441112 [Amniculicola lignicola CBS 123094]